MHLGTHSNSHHVAYQCIAPGRAEDELSWTHMSDEHMDPVTTAHLLHTNPYMLVHDCVC